MAKESIIQIRMDSHIRESVESLYKSLGTSFPEAVRVFAAQSIIEHGFPFVPKAYNKEVKSTRGRLASYASEDLRDKESLAFKNAMVAKHE